MKILLLDNYDSFTFNLYQLASEVFGPSVHVVRNDGPAAELHEGAFDAAIVSPGPGRPERPADFGLSRDVIASLGIPTLGVCLGHQGLCHAFGGRIVHAAEPMHGRQSEIFHDGTGLFHGIPSPFRVVRYHSLVCALPLPEALRLTAWTDDGVVMAVAHRTLPLWGVQFHPESICTEHGRVLLENFKTLCEDHIVRSGRALPATRPQAANSARTGLAEAKARERRTLVVRRLPQVHDDETLFESLFGDKPYAFWLDSSMSDPALGRFSFMGGYEARQVDALRYSVAAGRLESQRHGVSRELPDDLFVHLDAALREVEIAGPERPFDFAGGYVGYFGYELKSLCGGSAAHASPHPDAWLIHVDRFVAIDREARELWLVYIGGATDPTSGDPAAGDAVAQEDATRWFDALQAQLAEPAAVRPPRAAGNSGNFSAAQSHRRYLDNIDRCLAAIRDGESYEICLTTQFRATTDVDPFEYYKRLRRRNPAPYSAFLKFPELAIACSSPERFLKVGRDRTVESKPIKGTLRRGLNAREDAALRQLLGEDEKSRAENLMIVDLLRNDLGRVCEVGSVSVPSLMHVEAYATVHQLVSTIRGRLRADSTTVDLIQAAFPGGSMTGAPKKRTMTIIDALEEQARGPYSGTIGFLSFDGAADLNIVIRSAVFARGEVSIGVGGAIVAMSVPEDEWKEILLKAGGPVATFGDLAAPAPRLPED